VWQSAAVCGSVLLCVFGVGCIALESYFWYAEYCSVMSYVAVCCSVLQCVAVCCSVLQCCSVRTHDRVSHAAISLSSCVCARWTTHDHI